ncbi:MAG: hypothetical protein NTX64_07715 [Elusimicrobia bacterium]|nr:hypothetical protein [Elusimicrobiota bacterium]
MTSDSLLWLAELLEMESGFIEECLRCGALSPDDLPQQRAAVPAATAARLRRLRRLCLSLDVDVYAGAIIVDLLERLDELQREMEQGR